MQCRALQALTTLTTRLRKRPVLPGRNLEHRVDIKLRMRSYCHNTLPYCRCVHERWHLCMIYCNASNFQILALVFRCLDAERTTSGYETSYRRKSRDGSAWPGASTRSETAI